MQASKETKLLFNGMAGLTFGLLSGLVFSILFWFTDEMSTAYRQAAADDVAWLFLKSITNRFAVSAVLVFLATELLLYVLHVKNKKKVVLRIILAAAGLTGAAVLFLSSLYWFPEVVSRTGVFYLAGLGLCALVVSGAYTFYHARKSVVASFSAFRMPLLSLFMLIVLVNGVAVYKQQTASRTETNVIVILIDALRSDHLGCYGYDLPTSPILDAFAKESVIFKNSFAQSTHTKPTTASLFTSLYPSQHNVLLGNRRDDSGNFYSDVLDDSFITMAEFLTASGFNAAGFLDQGQLHSYMGFSQGFDYYNSYLKGAPQVNGDFFRWLPENKHRKFFAYLHYLDVHAPYSPSASYKEMFVKGESNLVIPEQVADWRKFKKKFDDIKHQFTQGDIEQLRSLYNAEIREFDDQLAVLFNRLKAEGVYENSLIIITADHGDSFMEHGEIDHGTTLYEEVLRIPLIVRFPGARHKGMIEMPVQTIDVLPTILDFFEVDPGNNLLMGRSLLSLLDDQREFNEIPIFSERMHLLSIRKGDYKLIYDKNEEAGELFELRSDPGEKENLYAYREWRDLSQRLLEELLTWSEGIKDIRPQTGSVKLDKGTVEKLKSLGYIK